MSDMRPITVMLSLLKHLCFAVVVAVGTLREVSAETESIDLKALAKKARPAVMLLVVSDATGKEIATGTGFLVSSDGKLITNHHVIESAASAIAKAENGGLFPVEGVLADDPKNDLVLLKIKGKDLPFLPLGNSDKVEAGTRIAVIGSPLGLEGTLSEGIVSAVRELMDGMKVLQVTAPISPGSSGSAVLNVKGEVIGVANSLLKGGQALNFAVPIGFANSLLAKASKSTKVQPLDELANSEDAFLSDRMEAYAAGGAEKLKKAKALVERYPKNADAYCVLAEAYAELNFAEDTLAAYRQAVKLKPDDAGVWVDFGYAYDRFGRTEDAMAAYQQAVKLDPNKSFAVGCRHLEFDRPELAIAAFREMVKLKPDDAWPWLKLGDAYLDSGRLDDAISAFEQSIKMQPMGLAWYNLGEAYRMSGRTKDAIRAYKEAIKIMPNSVPADMAWCGLGIVYRQAGRAKEAADAFRRARVPEERLRDWGLSKSPE